MKKLVCLVMLVVLVLSVNVSADVILATSVTNVGGHTDYWSPTQASDGIADSSSMWVTNDPGGWPSDYFATGAPNPALLFDLGASYELDALLLSGYGWNSAGGHGNNPSVMDVRFSTDGVTYTDPITLTPADGPQDPAQTLAISATAQYVEITITDNYYDELDAAYGGDRVGFADMAFSTVPEPGTMVLLGLGSLLLRKRK